MKIPANAFARCPECQRKVAAFRHEGRLIYTRHATGPGRWPRVNTTMCEATGWLVEDEELVP